MKQREGTQGNISPKKTCRRQQAHKELLNIPGHRRNANQNHGETPTHTHQDSCETPNTRNREKNKCWRNVGTSASLLWLVECDPVENALAAPQIVKPAGPAIPPQVYAPRKGDQDSHRHLCPSAR
ncbi:hypothetical protein mRhiFer1_009801 [Rhinolophus ferrumequinum]|uniref:Uncharacterized protein n=1 Tax=Rhinolophus ferrumequinum TaxID=59479 RepID=A0A7J7QXC2_RHIFE|nr:hypothetical protein mRhiFer1_009801 [Rhinolophus ferrumequinum]